MFSLYCDIIIHILWYLDYTTNTHLLHLLLILILVLVHMLVVGSQIHAQNCAPTTNLRQIYTHICVRVIGLNVVCTKVLHTTFQGKIISTFVSKDNILT